MTTVAEAEKIILGQIKNFGTEAMPFEQALNRALAEDLKADRDLPPFNRVTMDGIAVLYTAIASGINIFRVKSTQAAGDEPTGIDELDQCIEIMTGAALHDSVDTVIRYEDLDIKNGLATLTKADFKKAQNVHFKGKDKNAGDVVAFAGQKITPAIISLAASVGKSYLLVSKLPKIVIISSGDELVDVADTPTAYQIRRSNNYTVKAALANYGFPADMLHIPDDADIIGQQIQNCLQNYGVLLLSGGISMGKFDYIPQALEDLQVTKLFHKVQQRPGKPFWFGKHNNGAIVFAFPGNPVATFMCLHRYCFPWLDATFGMRQKAPMYAVLGSDLNFKPQLQYFLQVKLNFNQQGSLVASPVEGNGSGDFANLADTDAFMELPMERNEFKKGEAFRIWQF